MIKKSSEVSCYTAREWERTQNSALIFRGAYRTLTIFSSLVTFSVVTLKASTANSLDKSNLLHLASRVITLEFKEPIFFFFLISCLPNRKQFYRVSIKSFPDYRHLLQENYVEYKHFFFQKVTQEVFLQQIRTIKKICFVFHVVFL